MKNYWTMLEQWILKRGIREIDATVNKTYYTFVNMAGPIHLITVKDLGGFNLVHYAKPLR